MATTKRKTPATKGTAQKRRRKPAKKGDLDRRWSILLFGLGALFVLLSIVQGESAWAWIRQNILFGAFGISGWLLGPLCIYWAVLVGLEKPVFPTIIRCTLFLFALSGAALVFGEATFEGLKAGEVLEKLLYSGKEGAFGGGLISVLFGYTLLALCGRPAANILMVLIVIIAAMVFTGITPADIVRFIQGLAGRIPERELYEPDEEAQPAPKPALVPPPAKPAKRGRKKSVDIDLGPEEAPSQPGGAEQDDVVIGPGGTFGMNPLDDPPRAPVKASAEEIIEPFDPHSRQSLFGEDVPETPLFGADDPYAEAARKATAPASLFGDEGYPAPGLPGQEAGYNVQPSSLFAQKVAGNAAAKQPDLFVGQEDLFAENTAGDAPGLFEDTPDAGTPNLFGEAPGANGDLFGGMGTPTPKQFPQQAAAPVAEGAALAGEVTGAVQDPHVDALIDKAAAVKPEDKTTDERPQADIFQPYEYPPVTLFAQSPADNNAGAREEMKKTADLLVSTLASFGVQTRILDVSRGPSVTRYEIQPQTGVKISRITNLADDIALNLAAAGVRIEAPIPGKPAVGVEVPNRIKSTVSIRSILESSAFANASSPLSFALGKDIAGENVVVDLTKMPHLLVAGSTGSGKSVCINSIIMSMVYKSSPEDVRIVLVDPKVVELAEYNGIPHLLMPVVTEPRKAAGALGQMVAEMDKRYRTFAECNVRNIETYNKLAARKGDMEKMPYIAIVIDELADLMMTSGKEVEDYICRLAQKARAAGMHLIVATQRPSVDVITGLIKANIPSRIAFAVSSQVDSRTILDGAGAEKLLGMGDMLYMPVGASKPVRVQGTYVKDKEISAVIRYIKQNNGDARYDEDMIAQIDSRIQSDEGGEGAADGGDDMLNDKTFRDAVEIALDQGQISTSFLQRRLRLGYARAGRIMDEMERMHIISPPEGSKPRQVLISRDTWMEMSINKG